MAVDVEPYALGAMVAFCAASGDLETGGVLLGTYSSFGDRAIVARVIGPPVDSIHHRFGFVRGIKGLGARLRQAWTRGEYYVGEWHFHPRSSPSPSGLDRAQIVEFSRDSSYHCPHPVLIVIGGSSPTDWSMSVSVVIDGGVVRLDPRRNAPTEPTGPNAPVQPKRERLTNRE